jgi:hypothetical protein
MANAGQTSEAAKSRIDFETGECAGLLTEIAKA